MSTAAFSSDPDRALIFALRLTANAGNLPNEPFSSWKVWYQVPLVASGVQCGVLALGLAAAASRNGTFLRIIAVAAWVRPFRFISLLYWGFAYSVYYPLR